MSRMARVLVLRTATTDVCGARQSHSYANPANRTSGGVPRAACGVQVRQGRGGRALWPLRSARGFCYATIFPTRAGLRWWRIFHQWPSAGIPSAL